MTRLSAALAALSAISMLATPAEAGRTLITTIDMATFAGRCDAEGGIAVAAGSSGAQLCTLPSGAAVRCADEAVGALVCEVLIERRGRGVTAASIAAMPDGSPAVRLLAATD